MLGGAWQAIVHGVTEGQTRLSNLARTQDTPRASQAAPAVKNPLANAGDLRDASWEDPWRRAR